MRRLVVEEVFYTHKRKPGDYAVIVNDPRYANCLLLIAENVLDQIFSTKPGGGTACLREYTYPSMEVVRAAGIPTGWSQESGGFMILDRKVREMIDLAFLRIKKHVALQPEIKRIVYSADEAEPTLIGQGIFKIAYEVRVYISKAIHDLPHVCWETAVFPSLRSIRDDEIYAGAQIAQLVMERAVAMQCVHKLKHRLAELEGEEEGEASRAGQKKKGRLAQFKGEGGKAGMGARNDEGRPGGKGEACGGKQLKLEHFAS